MRQIDTEGVVDPDGRLTVRVPEDVQPGIHRVHLVIDEQPAGEVIGTDALGLTTFNLPWPPDFSLRREDMYNDCSR